MLEGGAGLSIAQLELIAKEQPKDVIVQMRLGEAYEKQGAPDKAAAAFEQALNVNPKLTTMVTKLAASSMPVRSRIKRKRSNTQKKRGNSRQGIPKSRLLLAGLAMKVAISVRGTSLLQEAARQRANDPAVLHDLAWAAYSLGKVDEGGAHAKGLGE